MLLASSTISHQKRAIASLTGYGASRLALSWPMSARWRSLITGNVPPLAHRPAARALHCVGPARARQYGKTPTEANAVSGHT